VAMNNSLFIDDLSISFQENLVGDFNTLKNMSKSVGMMKFPIEIPNIWKVIKFMFQTTNQKSNKHLPFGYLT
jgi:hypothetical protein